MASDISWHLSWVVYGFWGVILLIGIIRRLLHHLLSYRRAVLVRDLEGRQRQSERSAPLFGGVQHWIKANLITPAAVGSKHQRRSWFGTVPTRIEAIVVALFYLLVIGLCCVSYDLSWSSSHYNQANERWRTIADRTGKICYATLPILWIFAGRNNIFLWLTGWGFSTFNVFHRHIARVATVLAILHSIAFTAIEANEGRLAQSWKEKFWYMGGIATISMSLLLVLSSALFRRYCYEVFLLLHICLSVLAIVGLFYHTEIFSDKFNDYLWPMVAVWVFDRSARAVRLVYCNFDPTFSRGLVATKATATYLQDANVIRLEVIPGSNLLQPGPGQHYFIYQPARWKGWENHPFTLGAWHALNPPNNPDVRSCSTSDDSAIKKKDVKIQVLPVNSPMTPIGPNFANQKRKRIPQDSGNKLIFFVRPYSSWTIRLKEECLRSLSRSVKATALVEGPYGERSPLHMFETVVLIVGGTGLSGALPYLLDHVNRSAFGGTKTRHITLVWCAKQAAMIRDVAARELQPVLGRKDVSVHFHATSQYEIPIAMEARNIEKWVHAYPQLMISYRRPDIRHAIISVVGQAHAAGSAGGRVAILTCGPAAMADEARSAIHQVLRAGMRNVEYFEETFG
ncbi:hypothetical protein PV08_09286 [Exophiala spinifera]|uniref:FAD-binding FR-type domain-containing protein n=1 Tax=Exophiala spinifera TaxID=91928 RepID=A0A0D1ZGD1_9EURO|nr:uncharacterized protein PV08_09286 [Exophiala spinifera]KIW12012.1 hypothetical protein PV08_09286 [Exophiala spinifera]